jgi:putative endonuclease
MKNHNRIIGIWGENAAENFLLESGYKILSKNFRTPYGEIDIICSKLDNLVFVEVKTRMNKSYGNPEESINQRKLEHMKNSALYYVQENAYPGIWQIDVISIYKKVSNQLDIVHFENVIS